MIRKSKTPLFDCNAKLQYRSTDSAADLGKLHEDFGH